MKMKRRTHNSIIALFLLATSLASCDWETYDPNRFKKAQEQQETPGNNQPNNQPGGQSGQEDKVTYTYYLEIGDIPLLPCAGGSGSFTVRSYKKDNKGNTIKVPWSIEPLDGSIPAWLNIQTEAGDKQDDIVHIKAAGQVSSGGSSVKDYDLSTNGGSSKRTTANCYIVSCPGSYKVPLVYGNGITNGSTNAKAFNPEGTNSEKFLKPFLNHDNKGITDPWLKNNGAAPDGVTLVWEDSKGLVTDIALDADFLTFSVPQDAVEGNAVIAATQKGVIVWSWHIWLTSEDLGQTATAKTSKGTYDIAAMNLGHATDGKSLQNSVMARQCFLVIRQTEAGGQQTEKTVRQAGSSSASSTTGNIFCTFYQWGRKDALPPANDALTPRTCYTGEGNVLSVNAGPCFNIGWTIKNPAKFLVNESNRGPYGPLGTAQQNVWSPDYKTVYDPCPPGYRISPNAVLNAIAGSGTHAANKDNSGQTWSNGQESVFLPKSGFLDKQDGQPWYVRQQGWYWSAESSSDSHASCLEIGKSAFLSASSPKATGYAVRPIIDK